VTAYLIILNKLLWLFNDFAGASVVVFTQRFIITGADLFVYNYMQANPEKFAPHIIDNMHNYMIQVGHLKEDITDRKCETEKEEDKSSNSLVCW